MGNGEIKRDLEIGYALLGQKLDNLIDGFREQNESFKNWQETEKKRHEELEKKLMGLQTWQAAMEARWAGHKDLHTRIGEDLDEMQRKNRAYDWLTAIIGAISGILTALAK